MLNILSRILSIVNVSNVLLSFSYLILYIVYQCIHLDPNAKTKECVWYSRGFCKHGSACRHKHLKRVACPLFLAGFCPNGSLCSLAHPKYDLPITYERAIGNVA